MNQKVALDSCLDNAREIILQGRSHDYAFEKNGDFNTKSASQTPSKSLIKTKKTSMIK